MASKPLNDIPALYETYFLRDLTYAASGTIAIAFASLAVWGSLAPLIRLLDSHLAVSIALLVASYVLGLLLQEGFTLLRVFCTEPTTPGRFHSRHVLMAKIAERFGQMAIREIERTIYLKHVGSALGSAFLVSTLLLLLAAAIHGKPSYLLGVIPLLILFGICFRLNRDKLAQQNDALGDFAKRLRGGRTDAG